MSVVKNILHKNQNKKETNELIYLNWVPDESNERLEFLGDHVLKSIMGKYLYDRFPDEREGFLTRIKIRLEKSSTLHDFAQKLNFKQFLLLSLEVENETLLDYERGRNNPSYYEDAFEAFIGAIITDFPEKDGYQYAQRFVHNIIENEIDFRELILHDDNYKDKLQKTIQKIRIEQNEQIYWKNPEYVLIQEYTSIYNQKVFLKGVFLKLYEFESLNQQIQEKIINYNQKVRTILKDNIQLQEFFQQKDNLQEKILGIGESKKIIMAEQECAKECIQNLIL